jgi:tRNA 2-selenouridine synthase
VETYGSFGKEELKAATLRIQKKLGGLETRNAIQFIDEGNLTEAFSILLKYYDKFYLKATDQRPQENIEKVAIDKISPSSIATRISQSKAVSLR